MAAGNLKRNGNSGLGKGLSALLGKTSSLSEQKKDVTESSIENYSQANESKNKKTSKTQKKKTIKTSSKSRASKENTPKTASPTSDVLDASIQVSSSTKKQSSPTARISQSPHNLEVVEDNVSRETLHSIVNQDSILYVKPSNVKPNPKQPRQYFNKEKLEELATSLKENGILQPLLVTRLNDQYFQIIAGERRWRAACLAQLSEIPVLVRELAPEQILEQALIENIQREDLNPLEEAQAIQQLLQTYHLTHEHLAERIGKSRPAITNILRLLSLPEPIQRLMIEENLSSGHARALLALDQFDDQMALATKIISNNLSVRETEKQVQLILAKRRENLTESSSITTSHDLARMEVEEKLTHLWGVQVQLKEKKNKGKIILNYSNAEEREHLLALLIRQDNI